MERAEVCRTYERHLGRHQMTCISLCICVSIMYTCYSEILSRKLTYPTLGKGTIIFEMPLKRGYVSSLEGISCKTRILNFHTSYFRKSVSPRSFQKKKLSSKAVETISPWRCPCGFTLGPCSTPCDYPPRKVT